MDLSQTRKMSRACVLAAIGGLDPSAGAGLGRDLLTAEALGVAVRLVGTAFTEQSAEGVFSVEPRAADALEGALRHALRAPAPDAVKVGMIPDADRAAAVLRALEGFTGPVVVDPVLKASSGGALWVGPTAELLPGLLPLLRRATIVTPNVFEAEALTGRSMGSIGSIADAAAAAGDLRAAGVAAVLVKGGHLGGHMGGGRVGASLAESGAVTDILVTGAGEWRFSRPRIPGPSPRGTGCALATALAIELGGGLPLDEAVGRATAWLAARIAGAVELDGQRHLSGAARA
jgi:hydroxymethylpyrimidine/phosphomethylpyrimidine kinase